LAGLYPEAEASRRRPTSAGTAGRPEQVPPAPKPPCGRLRGILPGVATSTYSIWIAAAFGMTALWALVMIVNKSVLAYVDPTAVNFFVRIVAIVGLLLITVPLTVLRLWSNGFGINAAAAGWIALSAVATWLIAFTAYYYALRGERVAVVAPICSTDPLWTALFAWLILGSAFGTLTLAGMAVAMVGVLLITRWMGSGGGTEACALAGATHGDVLPEPATGSPSAPHASRLRLVTLAMVAAAGWGLGPVLVDQASAAFGKPTATMMLESQALGMLMLGVVLLTRRRPLATRRLTRLERRRAILLLVAAGLLEAAVSVLYYLAIAAIGPVLTVLIMATAPVFTIVFGAAFLHERVGLRLALAAVVTVAGVMLAAAAGLH
jgi:drug/metabolite transporter (DMT)-like permease